MPGNDRYVETTDLRMVPALLHAYSIARNTALMCGQPAIKAEFEARIAGLCEQVGVPNLHRHVDEGGFYQACNAIASAREWFWFTRQMSWEKSGEVLLVIDGRAVDLGHRLASDCPVLDGIRELVERNCHVGAVRLADVEDWREYDPDVHVEAARRPPDGPSP